MSALGKELIEQRFDSIIRANGDRGSIRAAKYYLHLSEVYLIQPDGKRHTPERPCASNFIVHPGETAFLSTSERISMPPNLIGVIGPRFANAEDGVFFFGGMLVDPGYGLDLDEGEPLYFNIANLGARPLELRAGRDEIASLAFFEVAGPADREELTVGELAVRTPRKIRKSLFDPERRLDPPSSLAVIEDQRRARERVEELGIALHQVMLFGVIVLAITLLAALVSALLSFDANTDAGGSLLSRSASPAKEADGILGPVATTLGVVILGVIVVVGFFYAILTLLSKAWVKRKVLRLDN